MKTRMKKVLSLFIAFSMVFSIFCTSIFEKNRAYAEEGNVQNQENQDSVYTINDAISVFTSYFNEEYYKRNRKVLNGWEYLAMKKAEGELSKDDWKINSRIAKQGEYDSLTTLGGKAKQSFVLLELGEDPTKYEGRNLIQELADELNKTTSIKFVLNEMQAIIAIDRYNSIYSDNKVDYNAEGLIKLILKEQGEDGAVSKSPNNTAYAVEVFSKHGDIQGVNEAKEKAINYLKNKMTPDGGIYLTRHFTHLHAEIIAELLKSGEFNNTEEWSKDGKSVINGLFIYWNGKFLTDKDGKKEHPTGLAYPYTLYALALLRDAGFGDYKLNGLKFDNLVKEEPEQVCKSNIVVVYPTDDGKLDIKLKPSVVEVSNKKQLAGLTVLGALEAATKEYEFKGSMVKSIYGIANEDSNGWIYTLNGEIPSTYANETVIKDGDKIVWYYSKNGMEGHIPTWEELTDQRVAVTGVTLDKENIVLKEGETLKLNAAIIPQNATNKNLTWTSGDTKVAVVNENGSVTGIKVGTTVITVTTLDGQKIAKCNVEVKAKESIEPKDYTKEVNASIESVSNIILKGTIGDWQAASLAALGKTVPESYLNTITEKIKNRDTDLFKNGKFEEASACARTIIGIVAAGKDPRDIGNYNLVEDLCSRDMLKLSDIYAITYSLIALDSGNFKLPKNCSFTREDLVNKIINMENKSGGWGFGASADVDTTAMVLGALSNYTNNVSVKESVDKAVKVLSSLQNSNGGYTSTWDNKDTSESTSQTIIALCALGIDPSSEMFTKGEKNLMDALFSFRTLDGGFAHNNEDLKIYNEFATEQAFRALAAYRRFKDGKTGSIYLLKEFKDDTKNEKEIDIRNLTFQREFKLDSEAKVTIQAISNCKDNKNVTLIVALFDENDKMINYVAVKHLIKPQEISELEGMIKLPKEGKYKVRAFVWDDFDKLNVLSDEIIIPVVE